MATANDNMLPEMTEDNLSIFIDCWEGFPCLWNPQNRDYKNKGEKAKALKNIAVSLAFRRCLFHHRYQNRNAMQSQPPKLLRLWAQPFCSNNNIREFASALKINQLKTRASFRWTSSASYCWRKYTSLNLEQTVALVARAKPESSEASSGS